MALNPILSGDKAQDWPFFLMLSALAFLASIMMLVVKVSYESAAHWGDDLSQTATVQVKPNALQDESELIAQTNAILRTHKEIQTKRRLSREESRDLLRPWLGNTPLPDEIILPLLWHITLMPEQKLEKQRLKHALTDKNIRADIDDHGRWAQDLRRSALTVQGMTLSALALILFTICVSIVFATRAALIGRRKLMNVLMLIGATPRFTARLFSRRFSAIAFKAALLGVILANLVLLSINLLAPHAPQILYFLPEWQLRHDDIALSLLMPVIIAILAGLTARGTAYSAVRKDYYI